MLPHSMSTLGTRVRLSPARSLRWVMPCTPSYVLSGIDVRLRNARRTSRPNRSEDLITLSLGPSRTGSRIAKPRPAAGPPSPWMSIATLACPRLMIRARPAHARPDAPVAGPRHDHPRAIPAQVSAQEPGDPPGEPRLGVTAVGLGPGRVAGFPLPAVPDQVIEVGRIGVVAAVMPGIDADDLPGERAAAAAGRGGASRRMGGAGRTGGMGCGRRPRVAGRRRLRAGRMLRAACRARLGCCRLGAGRSRMARAGAASRDGQAAGHGSRHQRQAGARTPRAAGHGVQSYRQCDQLRVSASPGGPPGQSAGYRGLRGDGQCRRRRRVKKGPSGRAVARLSAVTARRARR